MTVSQWLWILFLTAFALVAFAANSVICRYALADNSIDAASFTSLRLASGALVLLVLIGLFSRQTLSTQKQEKPSCSPSGNWFAAAMLFTYAAAFSYGYTLLDTATGALVLIGATQITMISVSIFRDQPLHWLEWLGTLITLGGFLYFVSPGLSAPSPIGFAIMAISGIAWAFYTLSGQGSKTPLQDTTRNFVRTLPMIAVLTLLTFQHFHISMQGAMLALISGGITSAIGYVAWYKVLKHYSVIQAAVMQISLPILAAVGGLVLIAEPLTPRLLIAATFVLGGILIVIWGKKLFKQKA